MNYVCLRNYEEHDTTIAVLVVAGEVIYMDTFGQHEYELREAEDFAQKIAKELNIEYVGYRTDV